MTSITQLYTHFKAHPRVVTDSRKVTEGALYFALKGPRFNGNDYAEQALEKGAAFAIIDEPKFNLGDRYVLVDNVLETLQQLALHHRRQFEIPLLAITGSNGKTTTKELLSKVLKSHYSTYFTKGNFNNHIGVPLTLLGMPKETEVAIIEMGANHVEEIHFLCTLAEPTHGLITNIGKAHLEGFGGLEGVKKGKSELYHYLKAHKGTLFINREERFLMDLAPDQVYKVIYGESQSPDSQSMILETKLVSTNPFIQIGFMDGDEEILVKTKLKGDYNFNNVMTAAALGVYFKVPALKIKEALEDYLPSNNRSQLLTVGSNTFFLDAYNANPDSMRKALINFAKADEASKIAIIGDMLELGEYSETEHLEMLRFAEKLELDQVITVGVEFEKVKIDLVNRLHFTNVQELKEWFDQQNFEDKYLLLKGSRGIGLEKLVAKV